MLPILVLHGNRSHLYLQDDDDYIDDDDKNDETQNGHNLANFEATTSIFGMVIDINGTYRLYFHAKS